MFNRWVVIATVVLSLAGPSANANILSGSVSFDAVSNLYTYNYALDNSQGPAAINQLAVIIDSAGLALNLDPVAIASPDGWNFVKAISGGSANPPVNEFGTFWMWQGDPLAVGDSLGGFSFTTAGAPVAGNGNNYFLFAPTYTGGPSPFEGIREYGHIVAPDFAPYVDPPPPIPEPQTWMGLAAGLLGLMIASSKKRGTGSE